MKQFIKLVVAAFVILAMLLSAFGCATQPSPTAAPPAPTAAVSTPTSPTSAPMAPTESPTSVSTAPAQQASDVIELRFHHHDPPQSYPGIHAFQAFADMIGEKTNGKVEVVVYPAETLGKASTSIDMAINGVADISWGTISMFPGRFPVTDLLSLPMVGVQSARHGSRVISEMYKTTPEIQKEWEDLQVLSLHSISPHHVGSTSKNIQTMEDLKGHRIRFMSGVPAKFGEALGATQVNIPMPDVFEALQKGTLDGYCTNWTGVNAFRFDEVIKYALDEPLYVSVFFTVMNKKKWDSLPPDVQQVFNELGESDYWWNSFAGAWDDGEKEAVEKAQNQGVQITKLSDDERARWTEVAEQVWDEYTKIADSKGVDGKAVREKTKETYDKYRVQ